MIDNKGIYEVDGFSYVNFNLLPRDVLKEILDWRNSDEVRSLMYTSTLISEEDHFKFVESLKTRTDKVYWLVKKGDEPIGVLNIINIDYEKKCCEPGFYMAPHVLNKGYGIQLLNNYKYFLIEKLGFNCLDGSNLITNENAILLSYFFGAVKDSLSEKDGKTYIHTKLLKENFKHYSPARVHIDYIKWLKTYNKDGIK